MLRRHHLQKIKAIITSRYLARTGKNPGIKPEQLFSDIIASHATENRRKGLDILKLTRRGARYHKEQVNGLPIFSIVWNTLDRKSQSYADTVKMQNLSMGDGYTMADTGRFNMFTALDRSFEAVDIGQIMKNRTSVNHLVYRSKLILRVNLTNYRLKSNHLFHCFTILNAQTQCKRLRHASPDSNSALANTRTHEHPNTRTHVKPPDR